MVGQTMNGNGSFQYQGMGAPVQKFNNVLTNEEIEMLMQKGEQFSLGITRDEYLRAICNHRNAEGNADTLIFDNLTGEARCRICGYQFRPIDPNEDPDIIKTDIDRIIDALQTIKLMYIDLPADAAREFFQIIPLLYKIPKLYEFAAKNIAKHESFNWQWSNRNMGTMNMFKNLNNLFNGQMMNNPQQFNTFENQFVNQPNNGYNYGPGEGNPLLSPQNQAVGFGYPGASVESSYHPGTPQGFKYSPNNQTNDPAPISTAGNTLEQATTTTTIKL